MNYSDTKSGPEESCGGGVAGGGAALGGGGGGGGGGGAEELVAEAAMRSALAAERQADSVAQVHTLRSA